MNNSDMIARLMKSNNNVLVAKRVKQIEILKERFAETDYKTAKNVQYERMGRELPYSWEEIYMQAEDLRKQINQYEEEIKNLLDLNKA